MEKWMEYYSSKEIELIQKIELENLEVFDSVCKKLNIDYFAYGGTLLGAVRHGGFIPWDDDLDIGMMREDYEYFIKNAYQYLPDNYYLQTPYNDKKTPFCYAKLRRNNTKYVEYGYHKLDIHHGIYIDIYPIDKLPQNIELLKKQHNRFQFFAKCYAWRQCPFSTAQKSLARRMLKRCVSIMFKCVPQSKFISIMDRIATQYNVVKGEFVYGNLYFPKPRNIFDQIYPLENVLFEDHKISIPADWKKHLKMRYGNYNDLPPESERIGHKPYLLEF